MGKLAKATKDSADSIANFLRDNLKSFSLKPYTIAEKAKDEEKTRAIKSATERVKVATERVKAKTGFEKARTGYIAAAGQYGVAVTDGEIEKNKQEAVLYKKGGEMYESIADKAISQGQMEAQKRESLARIKDKYNVGAFN